MALISPEDYLNKKGKKKEKETPSGLISPQEFLSSKSIKTPQIEEPKTTSFKIDPFQNKLLDDLKAKELRDSLFRPKKDDEVKTEPITLPEKVKDSRYAKVMDKIFQDNPVARVLNYPIAKLDEYSIPDSPMMGTREDGTFGNLPGTSARQAHAERNPVRSTGSEKLDKAGDVAGMMGSYLLNPANPAAGPVQLFNAARNIGMTKLGQGAINKTESAARATSKILPSRVVPNISANTGRRIATEAVREGAVGASYGVPSALIRGDTSGKEIATNVLVEGVLGAAGGAAFAGAGAAISKSVNSYKLNKEIRNFIKRTQEDMPIEHPPERIVQELYAVPKEKVSVKKTEYQKEYQQAIEDQYKYLKESMGQGAEPPGLIRDSEGVVTGSYGPISRNPKWYQDWLKENNNRRPNNKELRELAENHIKNGFQDVTMEAPPWKPRELAEIDDEINSVIQMLRENPDPKTKAALNEVLLSLEGAQKELTEYIPFESGTASLGVRGAQRSQTIDGRPLLPRATQAKSETAGTLTLAKGDKTTREIVKQSDIVKNLSEKLNVPIRVGRFNQKAHGIFKVRDEVVRTRRANDIPVIAHEVGHMLDKRYQLTSKAFDNELLKLGRVTSGKGYTQNQVRQEGTAEFFRLMLTEPQKAKAQAPKFYQQYMNKVPKDVQKILTDGQIQIQKYINQPILKKSISELSIGDKDKVKLPTLNKLYTMFVEELNPIDVALKPLGSKGKEVFEGFRLLRGSAGKARAYLRQGVVDENFKIVGKSFEEVLEPVRKNLDEFRSYIKDKRAIELDDRGIMAGTDLTRAERIMNINDLEQRFPEFIKAQKELLKYQDGPLGELVKSGMLDPSNVTEFKKMNQEYVPFFRDFSNEKVGGSGGSSSPIKQIKGSGRDIVDPLESIVKNTYHYIALAERNKAMLKLVDAVTKADGMGGIVERIPTPMQGSQFSLSELKTVLESAGAKTADMDMEAMASIFKPNTQIAGKDNIIAVFRNGKKELYELDPELFLAVNRANQEQMNVIMKAFSLPTRILRSGVVNTLEFWLKNMFRDQFEAAIKSNTGYIPYVDFIRGMYHVIGKTDMYTKFMSSGGAISFRQSLDRNYLQSDLRSILAKSFKDKTMNVIRNPIEAMQALSELSEVSTRVGVFSKALKKGESTQIAGLIARDYMDFSRKGSVGKHINQIIPFWNAQIQGLDKTIRMFTNPKTAPKALMKSVAYITTPTVGMYMAVKDDPRYKELPQWDKDLFWHFWVGDTHFRLPIPFELGVVFKVVPERLMAHALQDDKDAFKKLGETTFEAVNVFPWIEDVALLSPWIEAISNKTFMGSPIVPKREENLLPQDQSGPYTSNLAKFISKLPGVSSNYITDQTLGSPRKVDHIIRGYTGSLGQYATQILDKGAESIGLASKTPRPSTGLETLPFFKGMMGKTLSGSTDSIEKFYDRLNELEKKYNSARRNDKDFNDLGELKQLQKIQSAMSDFGKIYREIESNKDMTPQQKRDEIREINLAVNNLARLGLGKDALDMEDFFPSILRK